MARIFITGSSDGLGLLAAKKLVAERHEVVLHARNEKRAEETLKKVAGAESIFVADLSNIEEIKSLASQVNASGKFDATIYNAGIYNASSKEIFTVNVLAPYILTCLIEKPERLVYLSSAMHLSGHATLENSDSLINKTSYSDSKLYVTMFCKTVARRWPQVYANAVNPGWVPTKMGGIGAPDDLQKGYETQVWLATSNDENAKVSGHYFFHKKKSTCNPEADDIGFQNKLIALCEKITGVTFPES